MSGPRQKKRMLEAGELVTKKDKKGKSYKTIRRTDEKQKCSVCKKIGHNKRAQGSGGVSIIFYRSNCVNNAWIQWYVTIYVFRMWGLTVMGLLHQTQCPTLL
ncbi:hypothetical protein LINPERHAP2_LOCUS42313 [Linum perenne]